MDAAKRSIIGYRISQERDVGACILAMRMAFTHFKKIPENFHFIADGYSAYILAAQQFFREFGDDFKFNITQVIGLTNDDEVSKEFRPYKQMIERLNRTYKASYRPTNGFHNIDGANYDLALWVAFGDRSDTGQASALGAHTHGRAAHGAPQCVPQAGIQFQIQVKHRAQGSP